MRNVALLGFTVLVALALVGCGGVTKDKATKVYSEYYKATLDATKAKKEFKAQELMDKTAAANGFKDWIDFAVKAAKSLGQDEYKKVLDDAMKSYQKDLDAWMKAEQEKAAGGAKAEEGEKK